MSKVLTTHNSVEKVEALVQSTAPGSKYVHMTGLARKLAARLDEAERDLRRMTDDHAGCVVAMIPYVPSFGYLHDAIKELGKRSEQAERRAEHWQERYKEVEELLRIQRGITLEAERRLEAKQAEIDRLMLEYCPSEMTLEQIEKWKRSQKPVAASAPEHEPNEPPAPTDGTGRGGSTKEIE